MNAQQHPDKRGLPQGHSPLRRLISVPVIEHGLVRAMAGVGNKEADYNPTDVETLQLLAEEIWHILHRQRAARALRDSEERFRGLVEQSIAGIYMIQARQAQPDRISTDPGTCPGELRRAEEGGISLAGCRSRAAAP